MPNDACVCRCCQFWKEWYALEEKAGKGRQKLLRDALKHCAEALNAIAQSKGLVADHGDALDDALRLLRVSEES